MAKLLLIKTEKPGKALPGDVIGVFEDKHIFDKNEEQKFDVVSVPFTKKQIEDNIKVVIAGQVAIDREPVYKVNYNKETTEWTHNYDVDYGVLSSG